MRKTLAMWGACALMMLAFQAAFSRTLRCCRWKNFRSVRLSLDGMQARMEVDVYNPNPYAVTVTEANVTCL